MDTISYLERNAIDSVKWDQCISLASNGLIYGHSWYLDIMAEQWAAVVLNDYEAVMPIPWRKKWGLYYVYTPSFCNPLGIFSRSDNILVDQFLQHIPKHFQLWDLNLFLGDKLPAGEYAGIKRQNHILDLRPEYLSLSKNFRTSYRQIFNKKDQDSITVEMNIPVNKVIHAAKQEAKSGAVKYADYEKLIRLYHQLASQSNAETIGVYGQHKNLLASAIFFKTKTRLYYVLAGNNALGRSVAASHHLINAVIKKYAGSSLVLDFEGSDIPGIAFFFEGFGAITESYYYIHYNSLPWWCRWLKKADKGV